MIIKLYLFIFIITNSFTCVSLLHSYKVNEARQRKAIKKYRVFEGTEEYEVPS